MRPDQENDGFTPVKTLVLALVVAAMLAGVFLLVR